jgi:ribosome biogenesis protein Nip4
VKKHEDFFEEGYLHDKHHMWFKAKYQNLTTAVAFDEEQTNLKAVWKQKLDLAGFKLAVKARVTQVGEHTLKLKNKGTWSGGKFKMVNRFNYDQTQQLMNNVFSFKTLFEGLKLKHRIMFDCEKEKCLITNSVTRKLWANTIFAGNFSFEAISKAPAEYNAGIFINKSWLKMAITKNYVFGSDFKWGGAKTILQDLLTHGNMDWRVIMTASKDTKFGMDYFWNGSAKPRMLVGFEHELNKDVTVKGRINQEGKIDTCLIAKLQKGWDLTASVGFDSTAIAGKTEAIFGLGINGTL